LLLGRDPDTVNLCFCFAYVVFQSLKAHLSVPLGKQEHSLEADSFVRHVKDKLVELLHHSLVIDARCGPPMQDVISRAVEVPPIYLLCLAPVAHRTVFVSVEERHDTQFVHNVCRLALDGRVELVEWLSEEFEVVFNQIVFELL
jgi:hypothetical protein